MDQLKSFGKLRSLLPCGLDSRQTKNWKASDAEQSSWRSESLPIGQAGAAGDDEEAVWDEGEARGAQAKSSSFLIVYKMYV